MYAPDIHLISTQVLAHANIASRRKAEELVLEGVVQVNGETVTDVATHVLPTDKVVFGVIGGELV